MLYLSDLLHNIDMSFDMIAAKRFSTDFNRVLKKYFTDKKVKEYSSKLFSTNNISKDNKNHNFLFTRQMLKHFNTMINYAEKKLSTDDLFGFLLNLGRISLSKNELAFAEEINNQIISRSIENNKLIDIAAYAYFNLGKIANINGFYDDAMEFITKARKLFFEQFDFRGLAKSETYLGRIQLDLKNYKAAKKYFNYALTHYDYKKDLISTSDVEFELGKIEFILGNYIDSCSLFNRALIKFQRFNNIKKITELRIELGRLYFHMDDINSSIDELNKSMSTAIQCGDKVLLGYAFIYKACVYCEMGNMDLAEAYTEKSADIAFRNNIKSLMAKVFSIRGKIEKKYKHFDLAESYIIKGLNLNQDIGDEISSAEAYTDLGKLYIDKSEMEFAANYLKEALKFYKRIGVFRLETEINNYLQSQLN